MVMKAKMRHVAGVFALGGMLGAGCNDSGQHVRQVDFATTNAPAASAPSTNDGGYGKIGGATGAAIPPKDNKP